MIAMTMTLTIKITINVAIILCAAMYRKIYSIAIQSVRTRCL